MIDKETMETLFNRLMRQTEQNRADDSKSAELKEREGLLSTAVTTKRFQIEETRDDQFQMFSNFAGKAFGMMAGNNHHTRPIMQTLGFFGMAFSVAAQASRKNGSIDHINEALDRDLARIDHLTKKHRKTLDA